MSAIAALLIIMHIALLAGSSFYEAGEYLSFYPQELKIVFLGENYAMSENVRAYVKDYTEKVSRFYESFLPKYITYPIKKAATDFLSVAESSIEGVNSAFYTHLTRNI